MPREVSITTNSRNMGSAPRKEAYCQPPVGPVASRSMARDRPPLSPRTAAMTATMPKSMMMPWMKSFQAVAMYPPRITYMPVNTAMRSTHTA